MILLRMPLLVDLLELKTMVVKLKVVKMVYLSALMTVLMWVDSRALTSELAMASRMVQALEYL